jgi:large subunit ribosomal protein L17
MLAVLFAVVAAAGSWVRRRANADAPAAPAQWPPLHRDVVATGAAPAVDAIPTGWVAAGEGFEPPDGFPVKVKVSSGIFHVPGGRFYDRTNADRFYATADEAEADGYRRSKS